MGRFDGLGNTNYKKDVADLAALKPSIKESAVVDPLSIGIATGGQVLGAILSAKAKKKARTDNAIQASIKSEFSGRQAAEQNKEASRMRALESILSGARGALLR